MVFVLFKNNENVSENTVKLKLNMSSIFEKLVFHYLVLIDWFIYLFFNSGKIVV